MNLKRAFVIWTVSFSSFHCLIIPWNVFKSKNSLKDVANYTSAFSLGPGLNVSKAEVDQFIIFLESATNMTGSELASMFLSQNYSIAVTFSKFWTQLLQSILASNNGQLLDVMHGLNAQDWLNGICCKSRSQQPMNPKNKELPKIPVPKPAILANVEKDGSSVKVTFNLQAKGDKDGTVPDPGKKSRSTLVSQSVDPNPDPELSYETLQKWIEDYGLSASSLRDYLETYLFAGDRSWRASVATSGEDKNDHEGALDLTNRLVILGANINKALAQSTVSEEDEDEDIDAKKQTPYRFKNLADLKEDIPESNTRLRKRSIDTSSEYSSLVYSFSRLDTDSEEGQSGNEYKSQDEEYDIMGEEDDGKIYLDSKHRIFDNDEIVSPVSAQGIGEASARSKDYKQVIYDDTSHEAQLYKRGETGEKKAEEDCVPVTWYNVFHHSVFGKHKFCHV